jgi:hypothetical protein
MRYLAIGTIAIGACLVVVLGQRISEMDDQLEDARRALLVPQVGYFLPIFSTLDLDGVPVTIGETNPGERQIVVVFSTTCPYSQASLPAWQELARKLSDVDDPRISLHAISIDDEKETRAYRDDNRWDVSIVRFPDRRVSWLSRANRVPQTLVLNEEGVVLYARMGELQRGLPVDSILNILPDS